MPFFSNFPIFFSLNIYHLYYLLFIYSFIQSVNISLYYIYIYIYINYIISHIVVLSLLARLPNPLPRRLCSRDTCVTETARSPRTCWSPTAIADSFSEADPPRPFGFLRATFPPVGTWKDDRERPRRNADNVFSSLTLEKKRKERKKKKKSTLLQSSGRSTFSLPAFFGFSFLAFVFGLNSSFFFSISLLLWQSTALLPFLLTTTPTTTLPSHDFPHLLLHFLFILFFFRLSCQSRSLLVLSVPYQIFPSFFLPV